MAVVGGPGMSPRPVKPKKWPRQPRRVPKIQPCDHRSFLAIDDVECKGCGGKLVPHTAFFCYLRDEPVLPHPYGQEYHACSKCEEWVRTTEVETR